MATSSACDSPSACDPSSACDSSLVTVASISTRVPAMLTGFASSARSAFSSARATAMAGRVLEHKVIQIGVAGMLKSILDFIIEKK
jgi:hypothetical protein